MTRIVALLIAAASLLICLAAPILYALGHTDVERYKTAFLIASIAWFVSATLYAYRRAPERTVH